MNIKTLAIANQLNDYLITIMSHMDKDIWIRANLHLFFVPDNIYRVRGHESTDDLLHLGNIYILLISEKIKQPISY